MVDPVEHMARNRNSSGHSEALVREQAYAHIQRKIVSGELRAGEAVSELQIAKELGSSRTPIREALGQLVAVGLLEQTPNRGAVVIQFRRQDIIDLFELREALEAFAVGKVAQQSLRQSDLDRLRMLVSEIAELKIDLERGAGQELNPAQVQQFIRSDIGFHTLLLRMADNVRISKLVNDTRLLLRIFATRGMPKAAELGVIHRQHTAVLEAVACGDVQRAREAIAIHIRTSLQDRLDEFDTWEREASLEKIAPLLGVIPPDSGQRE